MAKRTKLGVKPEKKRTKPAKPKSEKDDDVKVVSLEELIGVLLKVPHRNSEGKKTE